MMENQLLNDEKQCAEHIMLVDLGRNDVGKVNTFLFLLLDSQTVKLVCCFQFDRNASVFKIYSD